MNTTENHTNAIQTEEILPECRVCLQTFSAEAVLYNLFEEWGAPWDYMQSTKAEDLAKLANIQLSITDKYSKVICELCCSRLQNACDFVSLAQKNDAIIKQRYKNQESLESEWPKPIQLDKNINGMDIEIKQEVLSDAEYDTNETEEAYKPEIPNLDIKIEPEEIIVPNPIQVTVNGTISEAQFDENNSSILINGKETYDDETYLDASIKEEPISDIEDNETSNDLPLDCLLCTKNFNSISGLKMPRSRPRTTKKAKWSKEDLENAVQAVRDGDTLRKASKKFSIPFSTLRERIKKNLPIIGPSLGRRPTFSPEEEKSMVENIKLLAKLFYGLSPPEICRAAFVFAEKNNIKHRFNRERKLAGNDWLYGFLKRNPSVTIRQPEATSIDRMTAFNKEEVTLFFNNLESIMEKHQFAASKIYNMDETGISTVQDPGTIIAEKGQKRVVSITSYERGKNISVICAVSAAGTYIPPMFIYPRTIMSPQLCNDGPTEAIYHCSKNGWTNQDLFMIWLKHFVKFARPSSAEPILLILDNHYSHVSLEAYMFCRENFIVLLCIPPHTSHRMQPLDVAFFGPLKTAFRTKCDLFMKSHALQKITPYYVAFIFNKAYCETATIQKGISGFKASGIIPIDPTIFGEEDFMAVDYLLGAEKDNITVMNNSTVSLVDQVTPTPKTNNLSGTRTQTQNTVTLSEFTKPLSGPSNILTPSKTILSPLPLPTLIKTKKRANTKQHSAILTASPLKRDLENKERKRKEKLLKDSKTTD